MVYFYLIPFSVLPSHNAQSQHQAQKLLHQEVKFVDYGQVFWQLQFVAFLHQITALLLDRFVFRIPKNSAPGLQFAFSFFERTRFAECIISGEIRRTFRIILAQEFPKNSENHFAIKMKKIIVFVGGLSRDAETQNVQKLDTKGVKPTSSILRVIILRGPPVGFDLSRPHSQEY